LNEILIGFWSLRIDESQAHCHPTDISVG